MMKETAILTARGWSGAGPWYQTLAFKEPVIDGTVNVIQGASEKQKQAFSNGSIEVSTISGWLVTFKATTNKPIVNIPIEFIYDETGLESLNSVVIVGTKTSATTFTGSATKEAFNKLKEGNVPLIVSILDSTTKATYMSIRMPSYTYDIASNTISAMAPIIPTAGGSLSFWGLLIKGSDLSVGGFVTSGGGGGGGSVFWGAILGTLADQTDLAAALALKASITYVDTQDGLKISKLGDVPDAPAGTKYRFPYHFEAPVQNANNISATFHTLILDSNASGGNYTITIPAADFTDSLAPKAGLLTKTLFDQKSKVSVSAAGTATDTVSFITVDGVEKKLAGGSEAVWGSITGTLLNQTDLANALASKINTANIKNAWGEVPGAGNVPSEALAKATFDLKQAIATLETDVASKGFTKNIGTITSIKMNGSVVSSSGEADLGTVLIAHQDITGKQDVANLVTSLSLSSDNDHYPGAKAVYDFVTEMAADFKGSVATKADLATITGMNINDWAIVLADETQSGKTTRYGYNGTTWNLQWAVNNTTFTSAQWDAINSGITATKVAIYDGYATTIANKLDKNGAITGATKCKITFDSKGLVTAGADLVESDLPAISISKITDLQTTLDGKQSATSLETDVANLGFTKNLGTITGITMNGTSMGSAGVVDLGTVITSLVGYATSEDLQQGLATREALLSDTQHAAVNSGITTEKVTTYDGYASGKQNKITYGTEDPTGGSEGDVYIKYTA